MAFGVVLLLAFGFGAYGCADRTPSDVDCRSDAECTDPTPFCAGGQCVACTQDSECGCHQVCNGNACVTFGAENPEQQFNAHGNWLGTPGTENYRLTGLCENTSDCGLGEICNPFTAGCVSAADFPSLCDAGSCPPGPGGILLACEPITQRCLPTALCRNNAQCCGTDEPLLCDPSRGVCSPPAAECVPPAEFSQACPTEPRVLGGCAEGTFCSPLARCVQCGCDADCDAGLKCYLPTQECKAADFCTQPSECEAGQSCDRLLSACRPFCDEENQAVCDEDEYCKIADNVCRPRSELPCVPDAWEPNDSIDEAFALPSLLPLPAAGQTTTLEDYSLCENDEDWYLLEAAAGDQITLDARSPSLLEAEVTVYAADGITALDTGVIDPAIADLLQFTVSRTATYFLRVESRAEEGDYEIVASRQSAAACEDLYEQGLTLGHDDSPNAASSLYDWTDQSVASGCVLTPVGTVTTVTCPQVMQLCPGDVDYFAIRVPAGAELEADLDNFGGDLDLFVSGPFVPETALEGEPQLDGSTGPAPSESVRTLSRFDRVFVLRIAPGVGHPSSISTAYDLQLVISEPTVVCPEDAYDHPTLSGTGAELTPPTLVLDPPGSNDASADLTRVALPTLPAETTLQISSDALTPLSLCRGDVDWYEIGVENAGDLAPIPAGYQVEIVIHPEDPADEPHITVAAGADPESLPFGSDDIENPSSELVIINPGPDRPFFVRVSGTHGPGLPPAHVDYRIDMTLRPPPACDEDALGDQPLLNPPDNNAPSRATPLIGSPWPSTVNESYVFSALAPEMLSLCASDDDWYRFSVPPGTELVIWTEHDPSEVELGLALYDPTAGDIENPTLGIPPAFGQLALSHRDGRGYQRVSTHNSGDVYVMVYNRTGWPLLDYRLGARLLPAVCIEDEFEAPPGNDVWDFAAPVFPTQTTYDPQLEIAREDPLALCTSAGGENDWYSVSLASGDTVTAWLLYSTADAKLDLSLYEPGPAGIVAPVQMDPFSSSAAPGTQSVEHTVSPTGPAGDYLIRVSPFNEPDAYYALETVVIRSCVDDGLEPQAQEEIASGFSWPDDLVISDGALCHDDDWFEISVPDGQTVTACALFSHSEADLDLEVYGDIDASDPGTPIGVGLLGASESKTDQERVVWTPTADPDGLFYVRFFLAPGAALTTDYQGLILSGDVACEPICNASFANPCSDHGVCDPAGNQGLGACTCDPGYRGMRCDQCLPDHFGVNCDPCACSGGQICDDGIAGTGACN